MLILEKMPNVGGITILAGGGIKAARDADEAFAYLKETQGERVSDSLVRTFAQGLVELHSYVDELAKVNDASVTIRNEGHSGIYDFPGRDTIYSLTVTDIPGFSGYDWTYTGKNLNGQRFFKVSRRRSGCRPGASGLAS